MYCRLLYLNRPNVTPESMMTLTAYLGPTRNCCPLTMVPSPDSAPPPSVGGAAPGSASAIAADLLPILTIWKILRLFVNTERMNEPVHSVSVCAVKINTNLMTRVTQANIAAIRRSNHPFNNSDIFAKLTNIDC